jgi:putative molybdopterin biosynthesis protein
MINEQYYTIEEVAKTLKVVYLTVYRWIQDGKLKAYKAGKQYRINKSDLDRFITSYERKV